MHLISPSQYILRLRQEISPKMKPWVIFNAVVSLDGRVGKSKQGELSNKLDQDRVQKLRGEVNALLLGVDSLSKMEKLEFPEEPLKIVVVDSKAKLSPNKKIFSAGREIIIATSSHASPLKIAKLKKRAKVIITGEYTVNLSELLKKLYHSGVRTILLEDGGDLTRRMFAEGLVNEIFLLVVPIFIGEGINLLPNLKKIKKGKLSLEGITQYGDQVLLHYLMK